MHHSDLHDELVQVAVILKRMVPDPNFSGQMALVCAGLSHELAITSDFLGRYRHAARFQQQQNGSPSYALDPKAKIERYKFFQFYAKFCPSTNKGIALANISTITKKVRADVIRIIGGTKEDALRGPFYTRCTRVDQGLKESPPPYDPYTMPIVVSAVPEPPYAPRYREVTSTSSIPREIAHEVIDALTNNSCATPLGLISPLSNRTASLQTPEEAAFISTASSSSSGRVTHDSSAFSSSGTDSDSRKSARQAHLERKKMQEDIQKRNACFMIGTQLVDLLKKGQLPNHLSPVDVAESVNRIFQTTKDNKTFVTSSELSTSVKNGNVGCVPPPQGRSSTMPTHLLEALSDLFFSHSALSQANAQKVLTRTALIELLEQVLKSHSSDHTQAKYLFEKIETLNATRQNIGIRDPREVIRFEWLTVTNLLKHFKSFENMLIEKKYGRRATAEERERDGVEVVWLPGQAGRSGNIDEMSLSLDYSKNGAGGRPGATFSCTGVRSSGEPEQKSSYKVTVLAGMTFDDEPIPPLIIIPSSAQEPMIKQELLKRFHQVEGQFGHSSKKRFDPMIAASPKGSITIDILRKYIKQFMIWYPDLADEDGKRFLLCIDSGPGRHDPQFLNEAAEMGVIISPKTPNTSEVTQEMDRLFALFKTILERNR